MTIEFACACGQPLAASEEHAGQQVRCPSCSSTLAVPARAPEQEMVEFNCTCGQVCKARAQYAGRRTSCPRCGASLLIPGDTFIPGHSAGGEGIHSGLPAAQAGLSERLPGRTADDDRALQGEKARKDRRGSRRWLVPAAVVLVLVGAAVGLWLFLRGGISSDFDLVPRDAQSFATVRVADVLESPLGKKAMERLGNNRALLKVLEKEVGLSLEDLERATFVVHDVERAEVWAILHASKPYDRDRILRVAKNPREKTHEGKTYYEHADIALYFADDRVLVIGSEAGVKRCLALPRRPKSGPLKDALRMASKGKNHLVVGVNLPASLTDRLRAEAQKKGAAGMLGPLLDLAGGYLTASVQEDVALELGLTFPSRARAKQAREMIAGWLESAKLLLPMLKQNVMAAPVGDMDRVQSQVRKVLDELKPRQSGRHVTMSWKLEGETLLAGLGMATLTATQKVRQAATRTQATNNLKQIGLALHSYHNANSHFPPAVIRDKNGRPLFSWRVALLPYLEQENLYRQLRLDEPWDSPHNKPLLAQTPKVYQLPGRSAPSGMTFFQVFTGPKTAFAGNQGLRFGAFTDGLSNTILVAEAARPVHWAAPGEEMEYSPQVSPRSRLGRHYGNGSLVLMGDASVRFMPGNISERTLRGLITPNGGEMVMTEGW